MSVEQRRKAMEEPVASPSSRQPPRMIDWRKGAMLVAEGASPAMIAAALGIDEEHFWKHFRQSPRFQRHIARAFEMRRDFVRLAALQSAASAAVPSSSANR